MLSPSNFLHLTFFSFLYICWIDDFSWFLFFFLKWKFWRVFISTIVATFSFLDNICQWFLTFFILIYCLNKYLEKTMRWEERYQTLLLGADIVPGVCSQLDINYTGWNWFHHISGLCHSFSSLHVSPLPIYILQCSLSVNENLFYYFISVTYFLKSCFSSLFHTWLLLISNLPFILLSTTG